MLYVGRETRHVLIGRTQAQRCLFVVFTLRGHAVRVISARDINKEERALQKKLLKLPKFRTEDEERDFWATMDLADYFESKNFQAASFPNLKPTSRAISLRLPEPMILRLKERANERHVPYQSLIKQYIAEGLKT